MIGVAWLQRRGKRPVQWPVEQAQVGRIADRDMARRPARIIERMGFEIGDIHPLQRGLVSGRKADRRRDSGFKGFLPTRHTEAPAVSGLEAGEMRWTPKIGPVVELRVYGDCGLGQATQTQPTK